MMSYHQDKVEQESHKLYARIEAQPENSKKILTEYDDALTRLEASIALKKEQLGDAYIKSKEYNDDAAMLHIGDQAYQQVYRAIIDKQLPWEVELDKKISKQRKIRERIEMALFASTLAKPYLQQYVDSVPITQQIASKKSIPAASMGEIISKAWQATKTGIAPGLATPVLAQEQAKLLFNGKDNKINLNDLEQEPNSNFGSNPGGKFIDKNNKQAYYIKFYHNEQQARTEFLATEIYAMFDLNVPTAFLDTMKDPESQETKLAFITKWEDNLEQICNWNNDCTKRITDAKDQLAKVHLISALVKNWDAIPQNILFKDNKIFVIDTGGSFEFRARGGVKVYGPQAEEFCSMVDKNRQSSQIFGSSFKEYTLEKADDLINWLNSYWDDNKIKALIETSGIANGEEIFTNLKSRFQHLQALLQEVKADKTLCEPIKAETVVIKTLQKEKVISEIPIISTTPEFKLERFADLKYNRLSQIGEFEGQKYQVAFLNTNKMQQAFNYKSLSEQDNQKSAVSLAMDIYNFFGINTPEVIFDYALNPNDNWYQSIVILDKTKTISDFNPYGSFLIQERAEQLLVYTYPFGEPNTTYSFAIADVKNLVAQVITTSKPYYKEGALESLNDNLIEELAARCGLKHSEEERLAVIHKISALKLIEGNHIKSNNDQTLKQIAQIQLISVLIGNIDLYAPSGTLELSKDGKVSVVAFNRIFEFYDIADSDINSRMEYIFKYAFEKYTINNSEEMLKWLDENWDDTKIKAVIKVRDTTGDVGDMLFVEMKKRLQTIKIALNAIKTNNLTQSFVKPKLIHFSDLKNIKYDHERLGKLTEVGELDGQKYRVNFLYEYKNIDNKEFSRYNSKENIISLAINIYALFGVDIPEVSFDYAVDPLDSYCFTEQLAVIVKIETDKNEPIDNDQLIERNAKIYLVSALIDNPATFTTYKNGEIIVDKFYENIGANAVKINPFYDLLNAGIIPEKVEILQSVFEKYTANKPKKMIKWLDDNWNDDKIKAVIQFSGAQSEIREYLFTKLTKRLQNIKDILNKAEPRSIKFVDFNYYDKNSGTAVLDEKTYKVTFFDDKKSKENETLLASNIYTLFGINMPEINFDHDADPKDWFESIELLDETKTIDSIPSFGFNGITRNNLVIQKQGEQLIVYTYPFGEPNATYSLPITEVEDIFEAIKASNESYIIGIMKRSTDSNLILALTKKCGLSKKIKLIVIAKIELNEGNLAFIIDANKDKVVEQIAKIQLISALVGNPHADTGLSADGKVIVNNPDESLQFNVSTTKDAFYNLVDPNVDLETAAIFKYPLKEYTVNKSAELIAWLKTCWSDEKINAAIKANGIEDGVESQRLFINLKTRLQDLQVILGDINQYDPEQYFIEKITAQLELKTRTFTPKNITYKFEPVGTAPRALDQMRLCCDKNNKCWLELKNFEFMVNGKESNQLVNIFIGNYEEDASAIKEAIEIYDPESAFVFQDAILRYSDQLGNPEALSLMDLAKVIQVGFDALYYHFDLTEKLDMVKTPLAINSAQDLAIFIKTKTAEYAKANKPRFYTSADIAKQEAIGSGFTMLYANPIYYGKITWYARPAGMSYQDYVAKSKATDNFLLGDPGYLINKHVLPPEKNLVYDKLKRLYPVQKEMPVTKNDKLCLMDIKKAKFSDIRDFTYNDIRPISPVYVFRGVDMSLNATYQTNGFQAPLARDKTQRELKELMNSDTSWRLGDGPTHVSTMGMYISASRNINVPKSGDYGQYVFVLFTDQGIDITDHVAQTTNGEMPYHYETVIPVKADFDTIVGVAKSKEIGLICLKNDLLIKDPENYWQILQIMGGKPQVTISNEKRLKIIASLKEAFYDLYTDETMSLDNCIKTLQVKLDNINAAEAKTTCMLSPWQNLAGYDLLTNKDNTLPDETARDKPKMQ